MFTTNEHRLKRVKNCTPQQLVRNGVQVNSINSADCTTVLSMQHLHALVLRLPGELR